MRPVPKGDLVIRLLLFLFALLARFAPPAPPYLGPSYRSSDGPNKPIDRIVIHSTVSPCAPGMARRIAQYFRSRTAGGSAHYIVDPGEVVQAVLDSVIAWHAPPNPRSIGVELCDMPTLFLRRFFPGGKVPKGTESGEVDDHRRAGSLNPIRWMLPNYRAMYRRAARLVAELCLAYDVPPYFRNARQLRRGLRGVTTHAQVSKAWGQSSHWDPGAWPRRAFMRRVRAEIEKILREAEGATA